MNEALRYWSGTSEDTFYVIGTVSGPHPYPEMVRDFQRIIGDEARAVFGKCGQLPDLGSSPASAVGQTPWACSIRSSTTPAK